MGRALPPNRPLQSWRPRAKEGGGFFSSWFYHHHRDSAHVRTEWSCNSQADPSWDSDQVIPSRMKSSASAPPGSARNKINIRILELKNREEWLLFPSLEERPIPWKSLSECFRCPQESQATILYYRSEIYAEINEISRNSHASEERVDYSQLSSNSLETLLTYWNGFGGWTSGHDPWKSMGVSYSELSYQVIADVFISSKDALTIPALLVHQIFYSFGFPKKIQSDQGSGFNNLLLRESLDAASVKQVSWALTILWVKVQLKDSTVRSRPTFQGFWNQKRRMINVSVQCSTLLSPFEMPHGYRPEYLLGIILDYL